VTSTGRLTGSCERNHTTVFYIRQSADPKLHFFKFVLFDLCGVTHPSVIRFKFFFKKDRSHSEPYLGKFLEGKRGADQ
jgi:hypothetical protein